MLQRYTDSSPPQQAGGLETRDVSAAVTTVGWAFSGYLMDLDISVTRAGWP